MDSSVNTEENNFIYVKFTPNEWEKAKNCIEQYIKYKERMRKYRDNKRGDVEKKPIGRKYIYDKVEYEVVDINTI